MVWTDNKVDGYRWSDMTQTWALALLEWVRYGLAHWADAVKNTSIFTDKSTSGSTVFTDVATNASTATDIEKRSAGEDESVLNIDNDDRLYIGNGQYLKLLETYPENIWTDKTKT